MKLLDANTMPAKIINIQHTKYSQCYKKYCECQTKRFFRCGLITDRTDTGNNKHMGPTSNPCGTLSGDSDQLERVKKRAYGDSLH